MRSGKSSRKFEFPANGLTEVIRCKYKLRILWDLQHGSRRFGEIRKSLSVGGLHTKEIAPRVLSRELKSMVELGLLHRRPYNVIPPRVEYGLTALGRSLLGVTSKILEWVARHPSYSQIAKRASLIRSQSILTSSTNLSSAREKRPPTRIEEIEDSPAWETISRASK